MTATYLNDIDAGMEKGSGDKISSILGSVLVSVLVAVVSYLGFSPSTYAGGLLEESTQKAVLLLEKTGAVWRSKKNCASCHHQTLPLIAGSLSHRAGIQIDEQMQNEQLYFVSRSLQANRGSFIGRIKDKALNPDPAYMYAFLLWGLTETSPTERSQINTIDREIRDSITPYIASLQQADGSWLSHLKRPPLEGNTFTATAVALRVLQKLGIEPEKCVLASKWLLKQVPIENEDRVFQLLGLYWTLDTPQTSEAPKIPDAVVSKIKNDIKLRAIELATSQNQDGGWSQKAGMLSDAYATGQALFALATTSSISGINTSDEVYKKGVKHLLETQSQEGSWHVKSRSKPIQGIFDTEFPHEKDQFISTAATSWAVMALSMALAN